MTERRAAGLMAAVGSTLLAGILASAVFIRNAWLSLVLVVLFSGLLLGWQQVLIRLSRKRRV